MDDDEQWDDFPEADEITMMNIEAEQEAIDNYEKVRRMIGLFEFYSLMNSESLEIALYNTKTCEVIYQMKNIFIAEEMYEECQVILGWEKTIQRLKQETHKIKHTKFKTNG